MAYRGTFKWLKDSGPTNGGTHASWGTRAASQGACEEKQDFLLKKKTDNDVKTGAITNSKFLFFLFGGQKESEHETQMV